MTQCMFVFLFYFHPVALSRYSFMSIYMDEGDQRRLRRRAGSNTVAQISLGITSRAGLFAALLGVLSALQGGVNGNMWKIGCDVHPPVPLPLVRFVPECRAKISSGNSLTALPNTPHIFLQFKNHLLLFERDYWSIRTDVIERICVRSEEKILAYLRLLFTGRCLDDMEY